MKAKLVLDQDCNPRNVPEHMKEFIAFRPHPHLREKKMVPYFPAGTVFEGDQATFMCRTGQATPCDEECAAEIQMTKDQLELQQLEYKMSDLGINDEQDRELYRSGVIKGYRTKPGSKDGEQEYIPGENWEKYHAAVAEAAEDNEDI